MFAFYDFRLPSSNVIKRLFIISDMHNMMLAQCSVCQFLLIGLYDTVSIFRVSDQLLRVNDIDVSCTEKAFIYQILHNSQEPVHIVSSHGF